MMGIFFEGLFFFLSLYCLRRQMYAGSYDDGMFWARWVLVCTLIQFGIFAKLAGV